MARRARGEGTIYKESHPTRATRWRGEKVVQLPDGRRQRIVVRARTRDDTLVALKRREREVVAANPDAERMTVNQYLDRWLAFKEPTIKRRTFLEYRDTLARTRDVLGDVRLARVRPTDVQLVITREQAAGRHATAVNVRRYLKQAFRQAEKWGLLAVSPVRNIDPVKAPAPKRSVLQPAEVQRVLHVSSEVTPRFYALFHTAVFTGLRHGELIALPMSNVTPTSVRVDRTHSRHDPRGFERPKTMAANRVVPIAPRTYEVIVQGRAHAPASEWAFHSSTGSMLMMRNVYRAWDRVKDKALVDVRIHDLRRTAATLWALNGATPKMIQMLLGHATPHLALAIYTDVMDDQLAGAALDPLALSGGESGGNKGVEIRALGENVGTGVEGE